MDDADQSAHEYTPTPNEDLQQAQQRPTDVSFALWTSALAHCVCTA